MPFKLFIGGKWIPSTSGRTFPSLNPATEKSIGQFQKGNEKDIELAVRSAEKSLPKWKSLPPPKRAEILFKASLLLRKEKEHLARLLTIEMGKPLFESRGEIQEAIDTAEFFSGEGRRLYGHTTTSELPSKFAMTVRQPVGIFGIISPWNFPIAIPSWKILPALVCGNAVVFKPSSDTPLCAIKFVEILSQAGLPPGVLNLVTGPGESAGNSLVTHPSVHGISFTGNFETGSWIQKNSGIKKIGLEMGGKNGIIILPDANLNLAVDGSIWGGFGTSGQRCTAASRILVHHSIKTQFERKMVSKIKSLKLGPGLSPSTDIGPLINRKAVEKVHKYTQIGIDEGAKLLTGGEPAKGTGFFYKPTLFTDVSPHMKIAQEEIFGPTVSIIPFKTLDDAIDIMNSIKYGLSSSIYTSSISSAFRAIQEIEAGLTYVNSPPIGSEAHLPFGGVKGSGSTREGGITAIDEFSHIKTVYFDYSNRLQRAQIDQ